MSTFFIKSGNRNPPITDILLDTDGVTPINLTDCTVEFVMKWASRRVSGAATVVSAVAGTVSYAWAEDDTSIPNVYSAEWVVTDNAGKKRTVPSSGYRTVEIEQSL